MIASTSALLLMPTEFIWDRTIFRLSRRGEFLVRYPTLCDQWRLAEISNNLGRKGWGTQILS